jgi:hypothetical protein
VSETALSTERARVSDQAFALGMGEIASAHWREVTPAIVEVFYRQLGERMTDAEWREVVDAACSSDRGSFPPTPGELLGLLAEIRATRSADEDGEDRDRLADELARRAGA